MHGQWRRLVNNVVTKASRTMHADCADTGTNHIVFISHISVPIRTIDSETISKRCNHIWLCSRSLDGDIRLLQNGDRPSDVAHIILALLILVTII